MHLNLKIYKSPRNMALALLGLQLLISYPSSPGTASCDLLRSMMLSFPLSTAGRGHPEKQTQSRPIRNPYEPLKVGIKALESPAKWYFSQAPCEGINIWQTQRFSGEFGTHLLPAKAEGIARWFRVSGQSFPRISQPPIATKRAPLQSFLEIQEIFL